MNLKFSRSGKWRKPTVLLVSALLIGCVVTNTFQPTNVSTQVVETLENGVKKDVKIKNTGSTAAFIRAAVVVTWQSADGKVYGRAPVADTDYTIMFNQTDWKLADDGFWYYKSAVDAGETTGNLIDSCALAGGATVPDGYTLHVEILGSGVQSVPEGVVCDVWSSGVSKLDNDGNLEVKGGAQ